MALYLQNPAAIVAFGALAVVVALHLLARRRVSVTVPTLIIWRRVTARAAGESASRRRVDLPLVLRLLAAAALAAAAVGPVILTLGAASRRVVVVLDNSLTMQTVSDGASRLEEAAAGAERLLAGLGPADRVALVTTAPHARLAAQMGEIPAARAGLASVRPADVRGELEGAVSVALARAAATGARVHVFTDKARPEPLAGEKLGWHVVGSTSRNVAIVAMDAVISGDKAKVFYAVRDYGTKPRPISIDARYLDGEKILEPGAIAGYHAWAPGRRGSVREIDLADHKGVMLKVTADGDDLAADNFAYAIRSRGAPFRAALVGRSSPAVARAVRASEDGAELFEVEDLAAARSLAPDMIILSVGTPGRVPGNTPVLYLKPAASVGPLHIENFPVASPGPLAATPGAELTAGLDLSGVSPREVARVKVTGEFRPLATAGGVPVLGMWYSRASARYFLGVTPEETSWPADPTWPIIFARLAERHASRAGGRLVWRRTSDEGPLAGRAPGEAVTGPRGECAPGSGASDAGLYRAGDAVWAVNVLDEDASDNRPPASDGGPSGAAGGLVASAGAPVERGLAAWLLGAAMVLLAAEWLVTSRREANL